MTKLKKYKPLKKKKNMDKNVKMAMWVAVATAVGVLLAKVIINTGVIEKIVPQKFESYDDEPVFY